MAEGNRTKKQIAQVLLHLVAEKPFSKITVQDMAKGAGINRQTFYYHFNDKKELLRWFYQQDSLCYLTTDELSLENWEEQARKMLVAMKANGAFYQATVAEQQDILVQEFVTITSKLFHKLFETVDQEGLLSEADKLFYGRFFSYGCSGVMMDWIREGFQETPLAISAQLFRLAKDVEFFSSRLYQTEQEELE